MQFAYGRAPKGGRNENLAAASAHDVHVSLQTPHAGASVVRRNMASRDAGLEALVAVAGY